MMACITEFWFRESELLRKDLYHGHTFSFKCSKLIRNGKYTPFPGTYIIYPLSDAVNRLLINMFLCRSFSKSTVP